MEEYKYIAKDFDISLYVRLRNFLVGFFGRRDLLKDFCTQNAIDYKPKRNKKYKLPENYLIKHGELKYLSGVRDKIILAFYERYKEAQDNNTKECQRLSSEMANLEEIISDYKNRLATSKKKLTPLKDPLERLHLQDIIGGLETSIINEKTNLANLEASYNEHRANFHNNIMNWEKQIDMVNNIFATRKDTFNRNIGRRITKYLNFTHFKSEYQPYSDSVKAIIKGEVNEK